jgi:hypothetical protein
MFMKFAPPVTARTNPAGKGTQSLAGTLKQKLLVSLEIFVPISMKHPLTRKMSMT